jgi:hypothetical protein
MTIFAVGVSRWSYFLAVIGKVDRLSTLVDLTSPRILQQVITPIYALVRVGVAGFKDRLAAAEVKLSPTLSGGEADYRSPA